MIAKSMMEATRLGVILFRGFAILDVTGPLQFFNQLSSSRPFEFSMIAKTMDPVSTCPPDHLIKEDAFRQINQQLLPTHTFNNAPPLDILLVPGGLGNRNETVFNDVSKFIKERYPQLKYLLSVCTGSAMVAASGVLDGRKATTNKFAWAFGTRHPTVNWVPKARWVVDGNIWSSSGVAAGMDMTYAFIASEFSTDLAQEIANIIEYEPHTDPDWDPFSVVWKVPSKSE